MGVFFKGRRFSTPTTQSVINDNAMRNTNLTVGNVVAILGRSASGAPKTPLVFGSPDDARYALNSGELLDAVLAAFAPSSETDGPSSVVAIRVQPAIQATGVIKDASNNTVVNLTSQGYGLRENLISFKLEAGSTTGFRVTTQRGSEYYTKDNVARNALLVNYTGGLASATITVDSAQVTLAAPAGTVVATLPFSSFATVQDISDRINLVAGFTSSVQGNSYALPTANALDFVTAQNIKATPYTVTANLQELINWFNSSQDGFIIASRPAATGTQPVLTAQTFLAGGSDGSTVTQDWADGFTALQTVDAQWITPVTSDPAIHAMADSHAVFMSTVANRERRAICGMAIGTTDAQAIAAAKLINSDRTSLVHIGHYDYDVNANLTLYAPYISAARIAGGFAGVNPGTPLTNKNFKCRGLERNLRNPTDTDPLIDGGVLCLENTKAGYKIVKSISTWLVNSNYNRVEQSCGVALDFTARNVREALDVLRGQKGNPLVLERAISITETTLKELARQEPQGPGVLAGNAQSPAYRNIVATLDGDVLRVQYECSPVIPVNYILVTIFAVPFSGSATSV